MMRVISKAALALCFALPVVATDLTDGIAAFNEGRYSVALDLLQKAARTGDKQAAIYLALAQAASSNCPAALPTLTAESKGTTDLSRLSGLAAARCYTTAGNTANALSLVEDLKTRFPSDPDVLYV